MATTFVGDVVGGPAKPFDRRVTLGPSTGCVARAGQDGKERANPSSTAAQSETGPAGAEYRLALTSYATDIKPLFRERDRGSTLSHFDLWSYDDVVQKKDAILGRLADGDMPCDGPWPADQVELFRSWVAAGTPA